MSRMISFFVSAILSVVLLLPCTTDAMQYGIVFDAPSGSVPLLNGSPDPYLYYRLNVCNGFDCVPSSIAAFYPAVNCPLGSTGCTEIATHSTPLGVTTRVRFSLTALTTAGRESVPSNIIEVDQLEIDGETTTQPNPPTNLAFSFPTTTSIPTTTTTSVPDTTTTTTVPVACVGSSLLSSAPEPTILVDSDTVPIELGMRFLSSVDGSVCAVRFFKGSDLNAGPHTVSVWSNDGTILGTGVSVNETSYGWQTVLLDTPVSILADTPYIVSYFASVGAYSATNNFFDTNIDVPPLYTLPVGPGTENGLYNYNNSGFPTNSYQNTSYYVDVIFQP